MRSLCVALLVALACVAHAQQLRILVDPQLAQPRVQRFITLDPSGTTVFFQQESVPSVHDVVDWMDRHLSAVEGMLSTVFGVYPCTYQSGLPSEMLTSARQVFLNHLEDEQYYDEDTSYDEYVSEAATAADDANPSAQRRVEAPRDKISAMIDQALADADADDGEVYVLDDPAQDAGQGTRYVGAGSLPVGLANALSDLLGSAIRALPLDRASEQQQQQHPNERELGATLWDSSSYDDEASSNGSSEDGPALKRIPGPHIFTNAEVEAMEEAAQMEAAEEAAFASWDFALFLALAAACVVVWAAMFTTCCQLRCAGRRGGCSRAEERRQQFMLDDDSTLDDELLEPLTLNDYQEPARVVNNPAFARSSA